MSIHWPNKADLYIPDSSGDMRLITPTTRFYVLQSDHEEIVGKLEQQVSVFANSLTEIGQREARWMMVETRLKSFISEKCGFIPEGSEKCTCPRCLFAADILAILKAEPPVGDGFQTVSNSDERVETEKRNG